MAAINLRGRNGGILSGMLVIVGLCLVGLLFSANAQAAGGTGMGWGYNYYGQVGNGAPTTTGCDCIPTPTAVNGLSEVTQISGGYYHTLALRSNGTVMAWGRNSTGALGNGTTTDSSSAAAVPGLSSVIAVAAGSEHSLALLSNGTVMAWGDNEDGELGLGTTTGPEDCGGSPCSKVPIPVPGLSNVVAISAGYYFSAALLADGSVVTWGYDYWGELGDGTGIQTGCECIDHPVAVPGVSGAVAISASWYTTMALLQDGTVKAWGYNYYGELGNGSQTLESTTGCYCLGPVSVNGVSGVKTIATGGYHGLAELSNGSVQGWGYNNEGELGNGTFTETGCECGLAPGPVSGLSSPQALSAGAYHSLALLPNGTVQGWGENGDGQVGDGTTEDRNVPTNVAGLSGVSGISANDYQSFAVVGPSQALNVALAGAGAGTVGGAGGILCPPNCGSRYPQGQVQTLRAVPGAGSGFAGFSGPCTGTGTCQVALGQDQTVTATFGPPKGTAITKAKISSRKKSARFVFAAPGAITGYQCKLVRPKPKKAHKPKGSKRLDRKGGKKKVSFSACGAPKVYKHLGPGHYTFKVRALDILGADAVPAVKHFKIKPPHKKAKHKNHKKHSQH
jgi:alpha-tubulin suppressor-like RCC1 family protein